MTTYQTFDDEKLLSLLAQGDELAFAQIYARHWEEMVDYAIRLTKSEDESADIVQEIFVSLWRRRALLHVPGTLISYLIKSTRNLSLRYIQNNISKSHFMERLSDTMNQKLYDMDLSDRLYIKEVQNHIDKIVANLPSKMKTVYMMSRNEQLSHREIAEKLGIAETTVKKQINNALKIISSTMNKDLILTISIISAFFLK